MSTVRLRWPVYWGYKDLDITLSIWLLFICTDKLLILEHVLYFDSWKLFDLEAKFFKTFRFLRKIIHQEDCPKKLSKKSCLIQRWTFLCSPKRHIWHKWIDYLQNFTLFNVLTMFCSFMDMDVLSKRGSYSPKRGFPWKNVSIFIIFYVNQSVILRMS